MCYSPFWRDSSETRDMGYHVSSVKHVQPTVSYCEVIFAVIIYKITTIAGLGGLRFGEEGQFSSLVNILCRSSSRAISSACQYMKVCSIYSVFVFRSTMQRNPISFIVLCFRDSLILPANSCFGVTEGQQTFKTKSPLNANPNTIIMHPCLPRLKPVLIPFTMQSPFLVQS